MQRDLITVTLNPTIDRVMEVPGFHLGGHLRGRMRTRTASGKAFNVSRALGLLGVSNTAAGWMGNDALTFFEQAARDAGATPRFTPIEAPTRENITILDPHADVETHIRDAGPTVTTAEYDRLASELSILAHHNATVVFSGSTAPGISMKQFGALLDLCAGRGANVVIDASGEAIREAASHSLWMIKPNLLELGELTGRTLNDDRDVLAAATELNRHIPIVVITLGNRGAYAVVQGGTFYGHIALPRERIKSTVGCGDAFLAGFLAGLYTTPEDHEAAFRLALAVAAASAMSELPAVFRMEDVEWSAQRAEIRAAG